MSAVLKAVHTVIVPYEPKYREAVLELAREMHAESVTWRDMLLDEHRLIGQLEASLAHGDYVRLVVRDGEVVGGFWGIVMSPYFSQSKVAKDQAWFIKRNHRGYVAIVRLVRGWEEWGRQRGVKKFILGQSVGVQVEATTELMKRMGYIVVGANAFKEL